MLMKYFRALLWNTGQDGSVTAAHNVPDVQCRMPPADREYLSGRMRKKGGYET